MAIGTEQDDRAARRILQAELRQLQEFLTEALADSAQVQREKEELILKLAATRNSEQLAQEKLAQVQASGADPDNQVIAALRAELTQAAVILARARRTMYDLATFSAGALGHDPQFYVGSEALRLIDATVESIEVSLVRTSG